MPIYFLGTQSRFASEAEADALLAQGWTLVPDKPAHDPATQAPPEWNKTTHVWEVRNLFADELAAMSATTDVDNGRAQVRAEMNALRNGTGTAAERIARVERGLWWLLRRELQ